MSDRNKKLYRIMNKSWMVNIVALLILFLFTILLCSNQPEEIDPNTLLPYFNIDTEVIYVFGSTILIYFFSKLISNLVLCNRSFIRPVPRIKLSRVSKILLKRKDNEAISDAMLSPVMDYIIGLIPFIVLTIILFIRIMILFISQEDSIGEYYIFVFFVGIILTAARHILRLDSEHSGNVDVAKKIFITCNGDLRNSTSNKLYARYEVPRVIEDRWEHR